MRAFGEIIIYAPLFTPPEHALNNDFAANSKIFSLLGYMKSIFPRSTIKEMFHERFKEIYRQDEIMFIDVLRSWKLP